MLVSPALPLAILVLSKITILDNLAECGDHSWYYQRIEDELAEPSSPHCSPKHSLTIQGKKGKNGMFVECIMAGTTVLGPLS